MYGLRDEATKRGISTNWDAGTGNVTVGSQSYTPQMLTGLGGVLENDSWKLPQQALNAMLGGASQAANTNAYGYTSPVQYQPYEYQAFNQQAPNYDQLLGSALTEYMREQPRLTEKAVQAVDANTAARGLYRSGVRDSMATQAATDLESSLRQLAQQQAQSRYGQELGAYQSALGAHNQMQQLMAQQHNMGQQFANENYWQTQNQQLAEREWANKLAQQAFDRDYADRQLAQQLQIAQMSRSGSGGGSTVPAQPYMSDMELFAELQDYIALADKEYSKADAYNSYLDREIAQIRDAVAWGAYTPDQAQRAIAYLEQHKRTPGSVITGKGTGAVETGMYSAYDPRTGRIVYE